MTCRYDDEAKDYLVDGEPCRRDEYGDLTKHCTCRKTCASHIGRDELTCARCIARTRANLRRIPELAALMMPVALGAGVNSEAANMAGPAADVAEWSDRRIAMRGHLAHWQQAGVITERQYFHARVTMEDDDEFHPYSVLGRWDMMIREDYNHPSDEPVTISNAAEYLDRHLHRIAQDPEQDFPLLYREIRRCRTHLESVMSDSRAKERGAPCPECRAKGKLIRLAREYGHWCEEMDCDKIHFLDESGDLWRCPANPNHWWNPRGYADLLDERQSARA